MLADKKANAGWSGMLLLDAGDALSPSHTLVDSQRARVVATAELLVAQYAIQGVDALAVGDRDLALGVDTLRRLAADSKVPFLSTNLLDRNGTPVFRRSIVIERAGVRVLVLGLVGVSGQRMSQPSLTADGLRFQAPIEAAKAAIAEAGPVDLVVVLSQLSPAEEGELAAALPSVRLILGGDSMGMSPDVNPSGAAVSVNGGQKGKHVAVMTITFSDPRGPSAPLVDPGRKAAIEGRKADAERRIQSLERLIAQSKEAGTTTDGAGTKPVRRTPVEAYERQLATARAELQLAAQELDEATTTPGQAGNRVEFDLIPMEPGITDEPKTKAAVDQFRTLWPDPTKSPAPIAPPAPPD